MKPHAVAKWRGSSRAGEGTISTLSGVFDNSIFTEGSAAMAVACTNPSEILAAAQAACITLMVAKELEKEKIIADEIETSSEIVLAPIEETWHIPRINVTVKAYLPEMDGRKFQALVDRAKAACPISRSLKSKVTVKGIVETPVGV